MFNLSTAIFIFSILTIKADWNDCTGSVILGNDGQNGTYPSSGNFNYSPGVNCTIKIMVKDNSYIYIGINANLTAADSLTATDNLDFKLNVPNLNTVWYSGATQTLNFVSNSYGNLIITYQYIPLDFTQPVKVHVGNGVTLFGSTMTQQPYVFYSSDSVAIFGQFLSNIKSDNQLNILQSTSLMVFSGYPGSQMIYLGSVYTLSLKNFYYSAKVLTVYSLSKVNDNQVILVKAQNDISKFSFFGLRYCRLPCQMTISTQKDIAGLAVASYPDDRQSATVTAATITGSLSWYPGSVTPSLGIPIATYTNLNSTLVGQAIPGPMRTFVVSAGSSATLSIGYYYKTDYLSYGSYVFTSSAYPYSYETQQINEQGASKLYSFKNTSLITVQNVDSYANVSIFISGKKIDLKNGTNYVQVASSMNITYRWHGQFDYGALVKFTLSAPAPATLPTTTPKGASWSSQGNLTFVAMFVSIFLWLLI